MPEQLQHLQRRLPNVDPGPDWLSQRRRCHFLYSSESSVSFSCRSRSRLISFSSCLYFRSMKRFWWAICGKLSGTGRGRAGNTGVDQGEQIKREKHRSRGVRRQGQFPTGWGQQFSSQIALTMVFIACVMLSLRSNERKCCRLYWN